VFPADYDLLVWRDLYSEHVFFYETLAGFSFEEVPELTVVYHWNGSGVIRLEKNEVYFGPGPTCPNFIDPDTEEITSLGIAYGNYAASVP